MFEACRAFYEETHAPTSFVPGKTYLPASAKTLDVTDLLYLADSALDLWLTSGRFAAELEKELCRLMNRRSPALLVNSGSSANLLAISSLGSSMLKSFGFSPIVKGDEVITVAAGFPTTVNPIVQNGWVPVFVDVELETLNAKIDVIREAQTSKTRAVVLAHTLGNPYRADLVADWCKAEGLYLIEDSCDALGGTINGHPVGSFGHYATLSFYPAHHITTGEGGSVIACKSDFRRVAESIRDWGRDCWCDPGKENTCGKRFGWHLGNLPEGYDHKYTYSTIGFNLKMTDMQAALGVSQIKKLESFVAARRANWNILFNGVQQSPTLSEALTPIQPTPQTNPSWFGFPMVCQKRIDRNKLVRFLEDHKVGTRLVFAGNLTRQPAYRGVDFRTHGTLEATDEVMRRAFWIGAHPSLDEVRLTYMLEQLESGVKTAYIPQ